MSVDINKLIKDWDSTKEYVERLGYTLGLYDFKSKRNTIIKVVNGQMKFIGYIKVGDFDSLEIVNKI